MQRDRRGSHGDGLLALGPRVHGRDEPAGFRRLAGPASCRSEFVAIMFWDSKLSMDTVWAIKLYFSLTPVDAAPVSIVVVLLRGKMFLLLVFL